MLDICSAFPVPGPVYHEYCECPEEDAQIWLKDLSCPSEEPQVTKDFSAFPRIDLQRMLDEVPSRFSQKMGAIVHYAILGNHIYRRSLGKYTDFKMFSDEMLLSLARKVYNSSYSFIDCLVALEGSAGTTSFYDQRTTMFASEKSFLILQLREMMSL